MYRGVCRGSGTCRSSGRDRGALRGLGRQLGYGGLSTFGGPSGRGPAAGCGAVQRMREVWGAHTCIQTPPPPRLCTYWKHSASALPFPTHTVCTRLSASHTVREAEWKGKTPCHAHVTSTNGRFRRKEEISTVGFMANPIYRSSLIPFA